MNAKILTGRTIRKGYSPYIDETTGTWWQYDEIEKKFVDTGIFPTGSIEEYVDILEEKTEEGVAEIEAARDEAKSAAEETKTELETLFAEKVAAIEAKGAETLATIPEDYTGLSNDVTTLKEDLAETDFRLSESVADILDGVMTSTEYNWSKNGSSTFPFGWRVGYYKSSDGTENTTNGYIRTLSTSFFKPNDSTKYFTVTAPVGYAIAAFEYDANGVYKQRIGDMNSTNPSKTESITIKVEDDSKYRFSVGKLPFNTEDFLTAEFINSIKLYEFANRIDELESSDKYTILKNDFNWEHIGSLQDPLGWVSGGFKASDAEHYNSEDYIRTTAYRFAPEDGTVEFTVTAPSGYAVAVYEMDENDIFVKTHGSANTTKTVTVNHTNGHLYKLSVGKFNGDATAHITKEFIHSIKVERKVLKSISPVKKHLNILVFGNSYAADSWGYVPFLLKKYGITCNIYLYYRGSGSIDRLKEEWTDRGDSGIDAWGQSHVRRLTHIDTRYAKKWDLNVSGFSAKDILEFANDTDRGIEWDIISLQQGGRQNAFTVAPGNGDPRKGTEPYLRQVIDLINETYKKPYTLAWFGTYSAIAGYAGNPSKGYPPVSGAEMDNRIDTLRATEAIYKAEPFGLLFPVNAAVFSARTCKSLASVDVSAIGNLWAADGVHLDAGIPSYIASCTIVQSIFDKYYNGMSIMQDDTVVTDTLIKTDWRCQFVITWQSNVKTNDSELYKLARKCAIVACNNPFDITPIYETNNEAQLQLAGTLDRYWADELIDTSHIINGTYVE